MERGSQLLPPHYALLLLQVPGLRGAAAEPDCEAGLRELQGGDVWSKVPAGEVHVTQLLWLVRGEGAGSSPQEADPGPV